VSRENAQPDRPKSRLLGGAIGGPVSAFRNHFPAPQNRASVETGFARARKLARKMLPLRQVRYFLSEVNSGQALAVTP
jgi:hypothetical protein